MSLESVSGIKSWEDPGLCTACRACEVVCSLHLTEQCNPYASAVRVALDRSDGSVHITVLETCDLCATEAGGPLCVRFCAPGALTDMHFLDSPCLEGKGR